MNVPSIPEVSPTRAVSQPLTFYCPCGMGPLVGQEIAVGLCYACLATLVVNKAVNR